MKDIEIGTDLTVKDGDFVIVDSREQHTQLLLLSSNGHWRQQPILGIGIHKYLLAPNSARQRNELAQKIRRQMDTDGLKPSIIEIDAQFKISIQ